MKNSIRTAVIICFAFLGALPLRGQELSLEIPLNWSTVEIRYTDKIWSDDAVHFQIKRQE